MNQTGKKMRADFAKLDRAFNPRCVAVVGDKDRLPWLCSQSTFKGKLYSVQISPATVKRIEALGVKNYNSLLDIPEPVDLAIVAVPRAAALRILEDCIRKGVAAAHFFTSGFSETDTEEGKRLESLLRERAEQASFHLIGPNCMGIFNPEVGLRQAEMQYTDVAGPVGFISQSGTHATTFSGVAHLQGVNIAKSVSFGNGIVLDSTDYLEYFGDDTHIKAIGMYLEGVKDGRQFLKVLKEVSARKPVVIWKGGRSGEGARAIASHTGSLAIPQVVWDAALRQCGAIKVSRLEELIDTLQALLYLPPVLGDRVAATGGSGGQSVAIADAFAEAGLSLPLLTQKSYDELAAFFSLIGASYRNPVDPGSANRVEMRRIFEILERDDNIDNLVMVLRIVPDWYTSWSFERDFNALVDIKKGTPKPVMAILLSSTTSEETQQVRDVTRRLQGEGIPSFTTFERGAQALKNALEYYRFKAVANT